MSSKAARYAGLGIGLSAALFVLTLRERARRSWFTLDPSETMLWALLRDAGRFVGMNTSTSKAFANGAWFVVAAALLLVVWRYRARIASGCASLAARVHRRV